ncbi:cellulase family glycosylhydrolase [Bacillus cereus group sp. BfR-BA-01349]|uniref:cellulase family glycosylhydrolase n=1 Tax=Bacillus cereus group sp. BfR-BA-01349 TaxID=2920312 RepID=UPI001F58D6C4
MTLCTRIWWGICFIGVLLTMNVYTESVYAENVEDKSEIGLQDVPLGKLKHIYDKNGRVLFLHGYNTASSAKGGVDGMPWISEKDIEKEAKELGSNFVRFLIFWDKIEPEKGTYNEEYLDKVSERIEWYKKQGMYVLLDMHQDLYGSKLTGNGAPAWATYDDGLPTKRQDPWALTYLQPGVLRAFENFWNDKYQVQTQYGEMWKHVAKRFANNEAIIGYEIMNEPFRGPNIWPSFEKDKLTKMYQKVIHDIRSVDQKSWIFYEPEVTLANQGFKSTLSKLQDPLPESSLVYAPHLYPALLETETYTGLTKGIVQETIRSWKKNRTEEAIKQEVPLLLGEFGLNATKEGALNYVTDVLANLESMGGTGFSYWSNDKGRWGPYDKNGDYNQLAEVLAYPYPRAISGTDISWKFKRSSNTLHVAWRSNSNIKEPTELFLSPKYYPNGWEIQAPASKTDKWDIKWDSTRNVMKIYAKEPSYAYEIVIVKK